MNSLSQTAESFGYLIVQVSTARGAIPLENAVVHIRGGEKENSGILYSLRTDRDGKTERILLPAPPRSASDAPGKTIPYTIYAIDVAKEGYIPASFQQVPVFPTITSIQPAIMIPYPEYAGAVPPGTYESFSADIRAEDPLSSSYDTKKETS